MSTDEGSGDESLDWTAREKLLNVTRQEEMEGLVDLIHSALGIELPDFFIPLSSRESEESSHGYRQ